jgi:hypothetical protein
MNEFDIRGRSIAQSFWTEMEKIANFRATLRSANKASREASEYGRDAGVGFFKRTFGGGERSQLVREKVRRAKSLKEKGMAGMKDRASKLRDMDHAGELDDIGKKELGHIERTYRRGRKGKRASIPGGGNYQKIDIPGDGKPMSMPKKMAIGTGAGLGLAGAGIGAKEIYDRKSQGYSGQGY